MKRILVVTSILLVAAGPAAAHMPEQAKLLAPDGVAGDRFGRSISIHLDTVVVGAPARVDNGVDSGAAYVFVRTGPFDWSYQDKLLPADGAAGDKFGRSVYVYGDFAIVGAPGDRDQGADTGAAYVFRRVGTSWTEEQKLTASDAAGGDAFGQQVSAWGDSVVIGAPGNEAAYAFVDGGGGAWSQQQQLSAFDGLAGDAFGNGVSIRGEGLVVGSPGNDEFAANAGAAYWFTRSGGAWALQQKYGAPLPAIDDHFGWSVALGDVFLAVGAPGSDDQGIDSGAMYEFQWNGSGWDPPEGTLVSGFAPAGPGDNLGDTIATEGVLLLAGQPYGDLQGVDSGGAQVFEEFAVGWGGDVLFPTDTGDGDQLGISVGLSRCWMVAGSWMDDDLGMDAGAAYAFLRDHATKLVNYCTAGTSAAGCQATLTAYGAASASMSSGFTVVAREVEGGKDGLFFFGTNGRQAQPWGNGTSSQCVVPPVQRLGLLTSVGTPAACDGKFAQDLNALWCPTCPKPAKNPGAGATVQIQLWYRDPQNTSNQSTSFSEGLEFLTCP